MGVLLGAGLACPAAAHGAGLSVSRVLATPGLPAAVAASRGMQAWVSPSGPGHRFAVTVRGPGGVRRLAATSAVGWIDGVKLGTDSRGRVIVVYSRCPYDPYGGGSDGHAGTDGCRLWWAPLQGGRARLIAGAPANSSVGVSVGGTVTFAVQHNTANEGGAARIEQTGLTGGRAHPLEVPKLSHATVEDISTSGSEVAFADDREEPSRGEVSDGVSEIWLLAPGSPASLVQSDSWESAEPAHTGRYFQGLTLTSSAVYAFLYLEVGAVEDAQSGYMLYPSATSLLEKISLPDLATDAVPWTPAAPFDKLGVAAEAYDPSDAELTAAMFSNVLGYERSTDPCAAGIVGKRSCPVVQTAQVTFG